MSWRYGRWTAEHPLPLGVGERALVGQTVALGATIATGTVVRGAVRVSCARRLGVETPIIDQAYAVLYEGKNPLQGVQELLGRDQKSERH